MHANNGFFAKKFCFRSFYDGQFVVYLMETFFICHSSVETVGLSFLIRISCAIYIPNP